jgi:beta-galactosidase
MKRAHLIKSKLMVLKLKGIFLSFWMFNLVMGLFAQKTFERNQPFDDQWRFCLGDAANAEHLDYSDIHWRNVNLPHDWSIEDMSGTQSPFDPNAVSGESSGYTIGGTGWYRKKFEVQAKDKGKRFIIIFDGVYCNSEVFINGKLLGRHPHGYTSFYFDLTENLNFGGSNVIAVKVYNEGKNSRWYSGSGIYRHVWLHMVQPISVEQYGTFVSTKELSSNSATINVATIVANRTGVSKDVKLIVLMKDASGVQVGRKDISSNIGAGRNADLSCDLIIKSPNLWSVDNPSLYISVSEVYVDGKLSDRTETHFGIRTLFFDAAKGFLLNGKSLKLKGGCVHHDNGPLGAKAFDRAEERRIEILKASGYNAIRTSHNPPSPAFLNACDKLGMLVINEAFDMWNTKKTPMDYQLSFNEWWQKDLDAMVLRDRNHPSVIMWSIGNEIPDMDKPEVVAIAERLAARIRFWDTTRPVTAAVHQFNDINPFMETLDVVGYNYANNKYKTDHEFMPNRVMVGSESFPLHAYNVWNDVLDNPYVIGDFVWTAFDYIGEASIGWRGFPSENTYPWKLAYCGDIDICGWKRPQSFYRDVLWNSNKLAVFVKAPKPTFEYNVKKADWSNWNWHDVVADWNWDGYVGKPMGVEVYSSFDNVELFLNDVSLGKKATNKSNQYIASWDVPYEIGTLKAVGYLGNTAAEIAELKSAGKVASINLQADRSVLCTSGQDLSYITVQLVDSNNNIHPKANNNIRFEIEGPGEIIAVGNGNPISDESFTQAQRNAWQGKCLVIVKAAKAEGVIKLTAKAKGLQNKSIMISVKKRY